MILFCCCCCCCCGGGCCDCSLGGGCTEYLRAGGGGGVGVGVWMGVLTIGVRITALGCWSRLDMEAVRILSLMLPVLCGTCGGGGRAGSARFGGSHFFTILVRILLVCEKTSLP